MTEQKKIKDLQETVQYYEEREHPLDGFERDLKDKEQELKDEESRLEAWERAIEAWEDRLLDRVLRLREWETRLLK